MGGLSRRGVARFDPHLWKQVGAGTLGYAEIREYTEPVRT